MKQTLSVESEDGSRRSVSEFLENGKQIENPEWNDLWSQIASQSVTTRVVGGKDINEIVVLDAGALVRHDEELAASTSVRKKRQDRTVVITVNDTIMPITIEEVELQRVADLQTIAAVRARVATEKGVSAAAINVQTYAEYYGS